jgi:hypothetical protein
MFLQLTLPGQTLSILKERKYTAKIAIFRMGYSRVINTGVKNNWQNT